MRTFSPPLWVSWILWTVLYGLVCLGLFTNARTLGIEESFVFMCYGLAFLVGLGFPSWWWLLGPPLVLLVLIIAVLPTAISTNWGFLVLPVLLIGWGALVLASAAGVGVRRAWSNRRGATGRDVNE